MGIACGTKVRVVWSLGYCQIDIYCWSVEADYRGGSGGRSRVDRKAE